MPFLPFFNSRPPLRRSDSSSSSTASSSSSSALTTSPTLSHSSSLQYSPPLSKVIVSALSPSKSPAIDQKNATSSNFSVIPISPSASTPSPPAPATSTSLSPHRPRLNPFSLSSLSIYHSHPARRLSTPIPPSLIGTQIIDSLNSPFHFRAVEGRKWSQKKDAGGTERAGKKQTGKRSDWADDVLGVMETREET